MFRSSDVADAILTSLPPKKRTALSPCPVPKGTDAQGRARRCGLCNCRRPCDVALTQLPGLRALLPPSSRGCPQAAYRGVEPVGQRPESRCRSVERVLGEGRGVARR